MTVGELVSILHQFPQDLNVYCPREDGDSIMHEEPLILGLSYEDEDGEHQFVSICSEGSEFYQEEDNEDSEDNSAS